MPVTVTRHELLLNLPIHSEIATIIILLQMKKPQEQKLRIENLYQFLHMKIETDPYHLTEVLYLGYCMMGKKPRRWGLLLCKEV